MLRRYQSSLTALGLKTISNYKNYGKRLEFSVSQQELFNNDNKQYLMLSYYRKYGHLFVQFDPLNLSNPQKEFPLVVDFGLKYQDELDNKTNLLIHNQQLQDLDQFEQYLRKMYTQSAGVEFEHIENEKERTWLYKNYERMISQQSTNSEKLTISNFLIQAEAIDHIMHKKFTTFKRYSGEGAESTIIALRALYAQAAELGVKHIVQTPTHRGRFPIMLSLLDYPPSDLFRKILGKSELPEEYTEGLDDVVHHVTCQNTKAFPGTGCQENQITISLVNNPSTLEHANPLSQGKTRAKQDDEMDPMSVLNVQIHGDSAYAGQGIVYESLQLQNLQHYSVQGTIHIAQNNQIGYTTNIDDSRSSRYCTDIGKAFNMPIIHVNGEDVEAVDKIFKFAVQYRQEFKKDILIDLICYRKYGHNELDEPEFTQPLMYHRIRKEQKSLPVKYFEKLLEQKVIKEDQYTKIRTKVESYLDKQFLVAKEQNQTLAKVTDPNSKGCKAFTHKWSNMKLSQFCDHYDAKTGLAKDYLKQLAEQSVFLPPDFALHPRLKKYFIDERLKQIKNNSIDWATGEVVAISSLLQDGYNVRLSGQDVQRGTFSQRHWIFKDQKTEEVWSPLEEVSGAKNLGRFQVCNSPLSEAAVMAFDFGYGMENPQNLVIWEAQFGDFYHTGQAMVDVFITNSEEKWMRQSSLVMMLPHGYDGAGPEHSSCRIERWLQNAVQNPPNFQFVVPTTSANVFHMLRRQMVRPYRKPLIVAGAKTLLRDKNVCSTFEELETKFQPLYLKKVDNPKAVILCSGKISYEIKDWLKNNQNDYCMIKIEELVPFPNNIVQEYLNSIKKGTKLVWVQEEPQNQGAYYYVKRWVPNLEYIGRPEIASSAVGWSERHNKEIKNMQQEVLNLVN